MHRRVDGNRKMVYGCCMLCVLCALCMLCAAVRAYAYNINTLSVKADATPPLAV